MYECHLRTAGFRPSVVDDRDLWSYYRAQVYSYGRKTIVLLGASRIQLDVIPHELEKMFPCYRIVQLAIDGKHPLSVLKDLSEDQGFRGIIVCSITALGFNRENWDDQSDFVEYYHNHFTLDKRVNRMIKTFIQQHLVIADPYVKFRKVFDYFLRRKRMPPPRYLVTCADRSRKADYSIVDVRAERAFRIKRIREIYEQNPAPPHQTWVRQAMAVEPFVAEIQGRGGKVVFLRLPSTGKHWELDQQFYPKDRYWDQFAAGTSAETIHFMNCSTLSEYNCPEGSHLDSKDAPTFTRDLGRELRKKGILSSCGYHQRTQYE